MKSAGNKGLAILIAVIALCICGSVVAQNSKDKAKTAESKPAVKLPVFKDFKFTDDDEKFFAWLNEYFPDAAANLKDFEKEPKEYKSNFATTKSSWRRLWKGYKENKKLGEALVVEVRLRNQRNGVLGKYKITTDKKAKDRLRVELTRVVSKEFDTAMEIKRIKYECLRPRIQGMKNYLAKREGEIKQLVEHKDAEVKKRVDELLKGTEKNYWRYPKSKGTAPKKGPSVKLAVFKDVKFTEEDQKFFVWLNEFFPDYAQDLKELEKNPQQYRDEFNTNKSMFRRLWKGYKFNHAYGKTLVEEVKLRVQRFDILKMMETAKSKEQKAKILNDLTKIVSKEFDVAVKVKNLKYEGLRKRITRKEKELANREDEVKKLVANKDQEVSKRVDDLITGEEKINWK